MMINSTLHDQNILRMKFYLRLEIDCWNFLIMNLHVKLWCVKLVVAQTVAGHGPQSVTTTTTKQVVITS